MAFGAVSSFFPSKFLIHLVGVTCFTGFLVHQVLFVKFSQQMVFMFLPVCLRCDALLS